MSELTKYDFFINELLELEKSIYLLVQKDDELFLEKKALIKELKLLKDENEILRMKLEEAESKTDDFDVTSNKLLLNSKDKKITKEKIDELINKIDNHLRS